MTVPVTGNVQTTCELGHVRLVDLVERRVLRRMRAAAVGRQVVYGLAPRVPLVVADVLGLA